MKIRLDSARFEPFVWQETVAIRAAQPAFEDGVGFSPIELHGTLEPESPNFRLTARLSYRQTVPCARCLAPVEGEVESGFELLIVRARSERQGRPERPRKAERNGADGGERQLTEEDFGVLEVVDGTLDTAPVVEEQVQLNLPAYPLCREDCAGLCPRCGKNWNAGPCDCPAPAADPRWGGLAELRSKLTGSRAGE